jgi:very-short-patch-repair endonuclease
VKVERAQGLPTGIRQQPGRSSRGKVYRDVSYDEFGLIVELDGRAFHDSTAARDRDLDRDLDAATEGRETVRLGYGQIFERPCATAARVTAILRRCGWPGDPATCPNCP